MENIIMNPYVYSGSKRMLKALDGQRTSAPVPSLAALIKSAFTTSFSPATAFAVVLFAASAAAGMSAIAYSEISNESFTQFAQSPNHHQQVLGAFTATAGQQVCGFNTANCLTYQLLDSSGQNWRAQINYQIGTGLTAAIYINGTPLATNLSGNGSVQTGYFLLSGSVYNIDLYQTRNGIPISILSNLSFTAPSITQTSQPQIQTSDSLNATAGQYYKATLNVTGGVGSPYTITTSQPLVDGLTFTQTYCAPTNNCAQVVSANSITLYGTPSQAGSFPFSIKATDAAGNANYAGFTLNVSASSSASGLTASLIGPASITVSPGQVTQLVGSFQVVNTSAVDNLTLNSITIQTATSGVAGNFQNLKVFVNSVQMGATQTALINNSTFVFSGGGVGRIPAGGTISVSLYADVVNGASFGPQNLFILNYVAVTSSLTGQALPSSIPLPGQLVTLQGSGSGQIAAVTISQSPTTPVARQAAMAQSGQVFGVIKFAETTGVEAATLTDLTLTFNATSGTTLNAGSDPSNTLSNITISATDNTGAILGTAFTKAVFTSQTSVSGGRVYTVTFNNINLPIPQGPARYMNLSIKADVNTFVNGAASGSQWTVGLASSSSAIIRGASTNALVTPNLVSNALSNVTTIARTAISFGSVGSITSPLPVTVNATGNPSPGEVMGIFSFTASPAGDAVLKSINLSQSGSAFGQGAVSYSVADATNGLGSPVGVGSITGAGSGSINLNLNSASAAGGVTISAGTTKYLVVTANTTAFGSNSSGAAGVYSLSLLNWTWSDQSSTLGQSGDASSVAAVTATGGPKIYASPSAPSAGSSTIVVNAYGTPVAGVYPHMTLTLGNTVLGAWDVSAISQAYTLSTNADLTSANLRVNFTNDAYQPPQDRNLFVDSISVNGKVYPSTDPSVYSTGSWDALTGCQAGFKKTNNLACNGYFEYQTKGAISPAPQGLAVLNISALAPAAAAVPNTSALLSARYNLQAVNNGVAIKTISLLLSGSATPSMFANAKLFLNGSQIGNTLPSLPGNGVLVFDLSASPAIIPAGQNAQLQLFVDVLSSASGSYAFGLQSASSLNAVDVVYNLAITPLANPSFPLLSGQIPITAAGSSAPGITAVSVTPINGSSAAGVSQTFTQVYTDSAGASGITEFWTFLRSAFAANPTDRACYVHWEKNGNKVYLTTDSASQPNPFQGPLIMGQPGTLSNSQCSLDVGASSVAASGNTLTVTLKETFTSSFVGSQQNFLDADNGINGSGWQQLGSWTITSGNSGGAVNTTNYAAAANGATAQASSEIMNGQYPASSVITGNRSGANWAAGGGWNDNTANNFPDWLEVDFSGSKQVSEIDVYTLADNYAAAVMPTAATSFTQYGITNFKLQYNNAGTWTDIAGAGLINNNLVWNKFKFSPITTDKIRVVVNDSADHIYTRIVDVEAY